MQALLAVALPSFRATGWDTCPSAEHYSLSESRQLGERGPAGEVGPSPAPSPRAVSLDGPPTLSANHECRIASILPRRGHSKEV